MPLTPSESDAALRYQIAYLRLISSDPEIRLFGERGREFLYRPRQLLVAEQDRKRVMDKLRQIGFPSEEGEGFARFTLLLLDKKADIPKIVSQLRDPRTWAQGERIPTVQPHHVVVGHSGSLMGGPEGPPQPASPIPPPTSSQLTVGQNVTVGIIDTGISVTASADHPSWLGGHYTIESGDEDAVVTPPPDQVLALQGGHGTFVAGVVRQTAPGVRFDPEKALNEHGIGDENMLVSAIQGLEPGVHIVNLSLGYYTQDNVPPGPVQNALDALNQNIVIVASAGNQGMSRPCWPAAFPRAVAVAALEQGSDGTLQPAPYSNHGDWVDACAVGDHVSTYVEGIWKLDTDPSGVNFDKYASWRGTSFAAPYVAGRIAALMTERGLTAQGAKAQLLSGAGKPGYGVLVA